MKLDLADIEAMDRPALVKVWEGMFNTSPPHRISHRMLKLMIGFEVQAQRHGGLSKTLKRQLAAVRAGKPVKSSAAGQLEPGARLIREWNGVSHVVDITEDGVMWQGKRYRSLSSVARAITGAHWSGPRFFGLRS
ncbi:DUF2924 domain-containing protein [Cucumibacter marinus]|uniref:DUF2924 domain-containing protein n=1 Tax=Cucumibacter marinus TaxID=1121252 RepID=UPI00056D1BE0|nr:DUF2924 domain-containing protein [Cucumibacter marinus]